MGFLHNGFLLVHRVNRRFQPATGNRLGNLANRRIGSNNFAFIARNWRKRVSSVLAVLTHRTIRRNHGAVVGRMDLHIVFVSAGFALRQEIHVSILIFSSGAASTARAFYLAVHLTMELRRRFVTHKLRNL
ncbi:MAG: hypothetical protein IT545_13010 [Rhodobacteraceae bacterium]|nr:hypothetical protein [Paracoccaceae bacterium]